MASRRRNDPRPTPATLLANQLLPPGVNGHDATLPPKPLDGSAARALLDRFVQGRRR
jgi:hypothetical protein